jgi:hypothetical protein
MLYTEPVIQTYYIFMHINVIKELLRSKVYNTRQEKANPILWTSTISDISLPVQKKNTLPIRNGGGGGGNDETTKKELKAYIRVRGASLVRPVVESSVTLSFDEATQTTCTILKSTESCHLLYTRKVK